MYLENGADAVKADAEAVGKVSGMGYKARASRDHPTFRSTLWPAPPRGRTLDVATRPPGIGSTVNASTICNKA
jgi:hypothetical protein